MQPQLKPINDQVPRLSDNIPSFESVIGQRPALVGSQFEWMVGKDCGGATRAQFHDLRIATYAMPTDCEGRHKLLGANGTRMTSPCFFEEHRDACPPGVIGHEQALPVRPIHRIAPVAGSDDTPELLVVDALQFAGRLMPVAHHGFNTIKGAESGQACPGQHPADDGLVHAHAAWQWTIAACDGDAVQRSAEPWRDRGERMEPLPGRRRRRGFTGAETAFCHLSNPLQAGEGRSGMLMGVPPVGFLEDWVFGDFQSLQPNSDDHRIRPIEASRPATGK